MKKISLILILLMFIVCVIVGYQATAVYFRTLSTVPPTSTPKEIQTQQSLFLLHVDRLKSPTPQLKSVWVLFLYISDIPSMTFVPLYQPETGIGSTFKPDAFSIEPDGEVAQEFVRQLQKTFVIDSSNMVILDDQALISFASRFPQQPDSTAAAFSGEHAAIEGMCAYLNQPEARKGVNLPWNEVLPDHFHTNMEFDQFLSNWIRITQAANPPLCKTIPGQ